MVAQRREGLIVEAVHDEVVVFSPERAEATALNQSAALVFERCDGEHTVDSIRQALADAGLDPATDDAVWLALDELAEAGLIELLIPPVAHLSRREMLTQYGIGAAALAALPVVESIRAPSPSAAGSPGSQVPNPTTTTTTTTTTVATPAPTASPTPAPTAAPTPAPTASPTTPAPTPRPTPSPSTNPPTPAPSTPAPTPSPSTPAPTTFE